MNLTKFLSAVDALSRPMDKGQLTAFIREIARVLPETARADFLERMKACTDSAEKENVYEKADKIKYEEIKGKLEEIESWEICLSGTLNEEYDDWYNSDSEEFLFEDPEGIGRTIEDACQFVHECVDKQLFDEGNEIAEILINLKIMVGGEYEDYTDEPLSIQDLANYNLAEINYKLLVIDALYLTYCVSPLDERAEALYGMIHNAGVKEISLEMIMQCGEELTEVQEFLPKWIAYLGNQNSHIAQVLLNEAIELTDDADSLLESARAYKEQHPGLYEKYIRENQDKISYENLMLAGEEALEGIAPKYQIRSRIALLLADIAVRKSGEVTADVEQYWMEAYRSDTRVVHFLRMMAECQDFYKWQEELQEINHSLLKRNRNGNIYSYSSSSELRENIPDQENIYLTAFLNGEYRFVKEQGMNHRGALGWSSTYMKDGLAAFLLILLNSGQLLQGGRAMLSKIVSSVSFSISEYRQGTVTEINETDTEWFLKCFIQSKRLHPMSEDEQISYLEWVTQLVRKRVDGIMEGNHRKYYYECAGYVAALGEVIESRGSLNGKQNLMLDYKQDYSRRRSFHEELRNFGMRDRK